MTKCNKNKGFTLFELLIVMSIAAILTGILGLSINYIHNTNVTAAANRLNAVINTARVKSMTQGPENGRLRLYYVDDDLYAQIGPDGGAELICSGLITCSYDGTNVLPNTEIWFKSSGAIDTSKTTYTSFYFTKGNKKVAVEIYAATGKHQVKAL